MKNRIIATIELGSSSIKTAIFTIDKDEHFYLAGYGRSLSRGINSGRIIDAEQAANSVIMSLKEAEDMAKVRVKSVVVGVGNEELKVQTIKHSFNITENRNSSVSREIIPHDISELLNEVSKKAYKADAQIIHEIPLYFQLDDKLERIADPIGKKGEIITTEAIVVSIPKSYLFEIDSVLELVGISMEDVVYKPFANSFSLLSDTDLKNGVLLIDIGGGTTSASFFKDKNMQIADFINVGGINITEDICKIFDMEFEEAEQFKIEQGDCEKFVYHEENLPIETNNSELIEEDLKNILGNLIKHRFEQVFECLKPFVNYLKDNKLLGSGIILTGGSSQIKGLTSLAEEIFNLPVKVGGYVKNIDGVDKLGSRQLNFTLPIGLAIYEFQASDIHLEGVFTTIGQAFIDVILYLKNLFKKLHCFVRRS